MRILFISSFYPPYIIGGWEQLVEEINQELQQRGHLARVLTSVQGVDIPRSENGIDRLLNLESNLYHYKLRDLFAYNRRLKDNLRYTRNAIESFNPDVVFIHIMWNLNRKIAWLVEQLRADRVVYYIADHWPYSPDPHTSYWQDPAQKPVTKIAKQILAPLALRFFEREKLKYKLQFQHVLCVSQSIKDGLIYKGGLRPNNIRVVYNGIDTSLFKPKMLDFKKSSKDLSLLFAGSLVWHKGVHTAIEAMAILSETSHLNVVTLTIVGSGHPDYENILREMVISEGLGQQIKFLGRVDRDEMPSLLRQFDCLVLPSIWDEPLARIVQEAMSSGLVVIGTETGGTKEILKHGETGLSFPPGDAGALAGCVKQLIDKPELRTKLSKNGRELVERQFDIHRMVDEIEAYLEDVIKPSSAIPGSVKHNQESLRVA
jgi:glycogen synthase